MKPPEQVKRELVRQWLDKAASDVGLAAYLLSADAPYLEAVAFHAQQAAEKYLKAFLVQHQIEFPKTHDLGELLDLAAQQDASLGESLNEITVLTAYGVDARYPADLPAVSAEEAKHSVELATKVRDAIVSLVTTR